MAQVISPVWKLALLLARLPGPWRRMARGSPWELRPPARGGASTRVGTHAPISGMSVAGVIADPDCRDTRRILSCPANLIFSRAYSSRETPEILAASTSEGVNVTFPGV